MIKLFNVLVIMSLIVLTITLQAQNNKPIIIDHNSTNLEIILDNNWVNTAKTNLRIGYGHTSHGSQLITGMNALKAFYTDGRFDWNSNGGNNNLTLKEGGTLEPDCGYAGWDDKTRTYLNANPNCNVIIWSWCGQVNDVDMNSHYLNRMAQLELDYPNVKFVYMTGHLEGLGPDGSLEIANNKIRDFCNQNNKILFDFADIEKYSPDGDINYDELYADDGCNYKKTGGGTGNWANEWLSANPDHILTKISAESGGCAHSVSLNCVRKGIASWYLWARLAGWDGITGTLVDENDNSNIVQIYPNPINSEFFNVKINKSDNETTTIKLSDLNGKLVNQIILNNNENEVQISTDDLGQGIYILSISSISRIETQKIVIYK